MKIFLPDIEYKSVCDIDIAPLIAGGFKCFLIDIDNTIVSHNSLNFFKDDFLWIHRVKTLKIPIILVTYNFEGRFVDQISKELGCPILKMRFPYFHFNPVRLAAEIMLVKPTEVVAINDFRIALAILRFFGCKKTILVNPISLDSEKSSPILRILRWIENQLIVPLLK